MRLYVTMVAYLCVLLLHSQDSLSTISLEEVMISGVRASEWIPVSQRTVNKEEIALFDIGQDAALMLGAFSPSVITSSDAGSNYGNYNQFRIRGIDQSRVNMTLNGVPLNDMVDQGVFFSNFADFSSSVESMQIQRGVGISSNGTASYAGSVSYESTRLDQKHPFGSFHMTTGSFGTFRVCAEGGTGLTKDDYAAYARVSRIASDGYKYHSGSDAQSFFFSSGKFFENGFLKLTGFAGKTQNEQAYLPVLLSDIEENSKTNYFSRNDTDDFEQELIQLQYVSSLSKALNWSTTFYYGGARGYFPFFDEYFGSQTIYALSNDHYGLSGQVNWHQKTVQVTGGFHAYLFDRSNETSSAPTVSTPYYQDKTEKDELSFFVKTEADLRSITLFADLQVRSVQMTFNSDSLRILGGNQEFSRNEVFFNPRVGLTYHLNLKTNFYASYGRTGREPTRTDLIQGDFNSAISSLNYQAFTDDLTIKSEFVNDLELGVRYTSDVFKLRLNGFFMSFSDEISIVGGLAQNSYVPLRQNVANSTRSGVEMDANIQALEKLNIRLQGTYMKTIVEAFDTGVEVLNNVSHAFAPELMLKPSIVWNNSNRWRLLLNAHYVGDSFMELGNDPEYVLPSFFLVNANVHWAISEEVSLGIWINNLFDEEYFTDGAPADLDYDGTPEGPGYKVQPPRNYLFTMSVRF